MGTMSQQLADAPLDTTVRVASETGRLTDVLLCPPDDYRWIPTNDIARRTIAERGEVDAAALRTQYAEFEATLAEAGVARHHLVPEEGLPYQVYTRDSSQMTPWGVARTRLAMPERRGEHAAVNAFYAAAGIPVWGPAPRDVIEGGDIHVVRDGLLIVGHSGGRTGRAAAEAFADLFRAEAWEALTVDFDEHHLHLDVIFSMVAPSLALVCESALPQDFLAALDERGIRRLPVSYDEAMGAMACNVLALGEERVLSPRHLARVNALLRAEGLTVLDPELDLFAAGGGSAHCMTMPLRRDGDHRSPGSPTSPPTEATA